MPYPTKSSRDDADPMTDSKTDPTKEYAKLRGELEASKQAEARARGGLDQVMAGIYREFGCKTLGEAEDVLVKMEAEALKARRKLRRALDSYKQETTAAAGDPDAPAAD